MLYSELVSLTEAVRGESLYHLTNKWWQISQDGYLKAQHLFPAEARVVAAGMGYTKHTKEFEDVVEKLNKGGYNFISMARTLGTTFADEVRMDTKPEDIIVAFEFDKRKLKNRYKLVNVSYYGDREGTDEQEERIVTKEEEFPLWDYVIGMHAYVEDDTDHARRWLSWFEEIARQNKVPGHVYRDWNKFRAARP